MVIGSFNRDRFFEGRVASGPNEKLKLEQPTLYSIALYALSYQELFSTSELHYLWKLMIIDFSTNH